MERPFKVRDRVTCHGLIRTDGKPVRGRVICNDRLAKRSGESIIVLADIDGWEVVETFKPDGRRWMPESKCHITLGWPEHEG